MDLGLTGAAAVITGGAQGIGRATAELFATEGAKVAIIDRNHDEAELVCRALTDNGHDCLALACDVSAEPDVITALGQVTQEWGHLDHVICCAGVSALYGRSSEEVSVSEWDDMMHVNVRGQWLIVKHALPQLRSRPNPSVALVASDSALVAAPGDVAYCTSKGAVLMLTKALSVDLSGDGIRVNCVCPSIVDTAQSRQALRLGPAGFAGADYPVQTPQDIARYLAFLASPVASTINGHALIADFGYSARSSFPA